MRLPHAFYTFPFRFDVERMRAEIEAVPQEHWRWHPDGFEGNSALPLISTEGGINDDYAPPMMQTEFLERMPYVQQVLAKFSTVHGRARLMRIEPRAGVPQHVDIQYYWRTHTRVHIPVITNPNIQFYCGGEVVHMAAGEAWTFDNWRLHRVVNETDTRRIHLTFDTYGSTNFWNMARPFGSNAHQTFVPYEEGVRPQLALETYPETLVMSPSELEIEFSRFMQDVSAHPRADRNAVARLDGMIHALCNEWKMLWHSRGPTTQNLPVFAGLTRNASRDIFAALPPDMEMSSNRWPARDILTSIFTAMLRQAPMALDAGSAKSISTKFDRPVFIVSAPRSGSTLLFESLAASEDLWTLGGEGHAHVESIRSLQPRNRGFDSNRLTAEDATEEVVARLRANYLHELRDSSGKTLRDRKADLPESVRFLEKTPKNALRIPFLKAAFPDARFIFLYRDAPANISSIMEAWRSGTFITYRALEGWQGPPWSLLLIPGWRDLAGRALPEIAVQQWAAANATILDDLAALPKDDWCVVRYEDFLADPARALEGLTAFIEIPYGAGLRKRAGEPLPPSAHTVTPPSQDKWRRNEAEIRPVLEQTGAITARLAKLGDPRKARM